MSEKIKLHFSLGTVNKHTRTHEFSKIISEQQVQNNKKRHTSKRERKKGRRKDSASCDSNLSPKKGFYCVQKQHRQKLTTIRIKREKQKKDGEAVI